MTRTNAQTALEEIWSLMVGAESMAYIGESISQLEHGLQTADRAAELGASTTLVLAALLHDVGHLLKDHEQMAALGVKDHEEVGADYLASLGFSKRVCELVRLHVDAKRYLCSKTPKYLEKLSDASVATLNWQGGPMTAVECRVFEAHDLFKDALRLRSFDEYAKRTDIRSPNRVRYRTLMEDHLLHSKGQYHATS